MSIRPVGLVLSYFDYTGEKRLIDEMIITMICLNSTGRRRKAAEGDSKGDSKKVCYRGDDILITKNESSDEEEDENKKENQDEVPQCY